MEKLKYMNHLAHRGFERIGGGLHSTVYAKPGSDRCIKVGSGDRWPDFIEWAFKQGYLGNFAPMVYSFKQHDGFYVAVMERLVCSFIDIEHDIKWPSNKWTIPQYRDWAQLNNYRNIPDKYAKENQSELFGDFAANLRANHLANDLHEGNFMLRKDGQIVCIDPTSNYAERPSTLRIRKGTAYDGTTRNQESKQGPAEVCKV